MLLLTNYDKKKIHTFNFTELLHNLKKLTKYFLKILNNSPQIKA